MSFRRQCALTLCGFHIEKYSRVSGVCGERALVDVRLIVNYRETAGVALRQRFPCGFASYKTDLHNLDQDVHVVYMPIENTRMFIFQGGLVGAGEMFARS